MEVEVLGTLPDNTPVERLSPETAGETKAPSFHAMIDNWLPGELRRFYFKPQAWKELGHLLRLIENGEVEVHPVTHDRLVASYEARAWENLDQTAQVRATRHLHRKYLSLHLEEGLEKITY